MESFINPLFNVHTKYKKMNIINPYRFGDKNATIKTNLLSAYGFEETSGTTLEDLHGSNDLTMSGSPTVNQTGKKGKCFRFDGTNDYCYKSSNFPHLANYTISMWVNVDDATRQQYLYSLSYNLSGGSQLFYINSNGNIAVYSLGATAKLNESSTSLTTATWQMLTVRRSGTTLKIHLGTTEIYSGTTLSEDFDRERFALGWAVARNNSSTYFDGLMDLVYIWQKQITTVELSWLHNSGNGREYSEF